MKVENHFLSIVRVRGRYLFGNIVFRLLEGILQSRVSMSLTVPSGSENLSDFRFLKTIGFNGPRGGMWGGRGGREGRCIDLSVVVGGRIEYANVRDRIIPHGAERVGLICVEAGAIFQSVRAVVLPVQIFCRMRDNFVCVIVPNFFADHIPTGRIALLLRLIIMDGAGLSIWFSGNSFISFIPATCFAVSRAACLKPGRKGSKTSWGESHS